MEQNIHDFLAEKHFDMVINLPMRNSGSRRASSFITQGYRTRRMAVDREIPLITDVKKAKLFIEVCIRKGLAILAFISVVAVNNRSYKTNEFELFLCQYLKNNIYNIRLIPLIMSQYSFEMFSFVALLFVVKHVNIDRHHC